MLLTTIGARTGRTRTRPLVYLPDGGGLIVVASNFGRRNHPAWYHNLLANPKVDVVAGDHSGTYTAREMTDPAERERAWAMAVGTAPVWAAYDARAGDRRIPLIRLTRLDLIGP